MMKRITLILLFVLLIGAVQAGIPFFRAIRVNRENTTLRVQVLYQDKEGYIWVGADDGLYKYDGYVFDRILLAGQAASENVTAIAEDAGGRLLIGMNNGRLLRYRENKLERLQSPAKSPIRTILDYKGKSIWLATYGDGIYYWKPGGWHHMAGIPDPFVYGITQHPDGDLLAGTDLGLVVIKPNDRQLHYRVYDASHGLPDNMVRTIHCSMNGEVWLGLEEKGFCKFDKRTGTFEIPSSISDWQSGAVTNAIRLDNEFWIGTEHNGIIDFEFAGDRRLRQFDPAHGFAYTKISTMLRDRQGNVWVATDDKLLVSPGEKVELTEGDGSLQFDSINAITFDHERNLWFSNHHGLIRYNYRVPGSTKTFMNQPEYRNLHIVSLYEDETGYIWVGTFDNGLYRLDPITGSVKRYAESEGLQNANVISIGGKGNEIWLATLGGVTRCTTSSDPMDDLKGNVTFTYFPDSQGPSNTFVYSVYIDSRGTVWFGTDGKGLIQFSNGRFHPVTTSLGDKGKVVYSITEDLGGNIWFTTLNHGVYRYDGSSFRNFTLTDGLRELNLAGIARDNDGNIVVVHQKGMDLINPVTYDFDYIGREAGIEELDCDLNAVARDERGNIWAGSQKGLIRFFNYSKAVARRPQTHIRRIYAFMKPGANLRDTVYEYNQNQLSIEYIGLWYSDPEAVSYRYRLLGYSNKWIDTRDRIVTYPNLPPGLYTFEVVSSNNNRFYHPVITRFSFRIKKPLWRESWFILTMIVLGGGALLGFLRDREMRYRRMESLKKEKIEYQFETLKSQVNPHFLFNSFNTLISIIDDDRDKAVHYVEMLSDYFRSMVQHRDRDTILLGEELEMVNTYFYLQQQRFGAVLSLEIRLPDDWKTRYRLPPLSLQLLIENAVKHNAVSYETPLHIVVEPHDYATLVVRNNLNPKLNADRSTGIGLENIINRFRILTTREVVVHKTEKEFIIEVPLIPVSE